MQAYAHFLLVDSVAPQYEAFEAGFRQVVVHLWQLTTARDPAPHPPSDHAQWSACTCSVQVSDGPVMSMLFPEELELLLCGGDVTGSLHA